MGNSGYIDQVLARREAERGAWLHQMSLANEARLEAHRLREALQGLVTAVHPFDELRRAENWDRVGVDPDWKDTTAFAHKRGERQQLADALVKARTALEHGPKQAKPGEDV